MQTPSKAPWAIEFRDVYKSFRRPEERTLKEFLPAFVLGRGFSHSLDVLRGITFRVERGEALGILGRNGSGKSTVLKLVAGVTAPTAGEVLVAGRISPLIELGAGFHPELSARDNIFLNGSILGMSRREVERRLDAIIEFAELQAFVDTPVKRYSSGMYARLGFSVAVHADPDVLLVDETLSVGDTAFQEKCMAKMTEFKQAGVTIVLVSHALDVVQRFCDRAILLEDGHIAAEGAAAGVVEEYRRRSGTAAPVNTP